MSWLPPGLAALASPRRLLRAAFILAVVVFLAVTARQAHAQNVFAVGGHFGVHNLPEQDQTRVGYGIRFTWAAYAPFVSLDNEVNFFPTTSSGDLGETQAFFGLKFGKTIGRWGGFLKVRPGFTHFGGGAFPARLSERTKFALDLGGGVEYALAPLIGLRVDFSDVRIHYGDAVILETPAGPAGPPLGTKNTFQTTMGVVLRF